MPEIPNVIASETIEVEWGNLIRDRTVQRYATVAARTAAHGAATDGDLSFLEDSGLVYIFDSGNWRPLVTPQLEIEGYTEVTTTSIGSSPAIEATVALTIPSTWLTWKVFAIATGNYKLAAAGFLTYRLRLDGTDLQANSSYDDAVGANSKTPFSVAGRRIGLSTTGVRNMELIANTSAGLGDLTQVALYAVAKRQT